MTYLYLNIIYFLELFIHKIKCKLTNCLADMSVDSMSDVKKTKLKYLALGSHMIDIKMMIDIKIFKMYAKNMFKACIGIHSFINSLTVP